jgi:lysozyme
MIRRIIDISHHEEPIDFQKVAVDGIVAIIAKATEGTSWIDPAYARFKVAAAKIQLPSPSTINQKRAGGAVPSTINYQQSTSRFLWGSYHFGTGADVNTQVDHYLSVVKPNPTELVCLDFEENPSGSSMTSEQAREFVSLFRERSGRYPILYGGAWLKEQIKGKTDSILAKCPLWIAQYAQRPILPSGWTKYSLWQYTDGVSGPEPREVNGIGPCDRNQYGGTITQLQHAWPF